MTAGLTDKVKPNFSFLNAVSDQTAKIMFHHCAWYEITDPSPSFVLFYEVLQGPEIADHIWKVF